MTRRLSTQAVSFALAAFITLAMLGSVNGLATSEPTPAQMAHVMQPGAQT